MKTIAIMDTSIMSFNIGDQIIMESARKGLYDVTKNAFVVNMPTHTPLFHWWQFSFRHNDSLTINLNKIDYKFVCGTNLLAKDMKKRQNTWNLYKWDTKYFKDFILLGVGTDNLSKCANSYTRDFYNAALKHDILHSVRDEKTKEFLNSMGFKAINTGCPTIWGLTKKHCQDIPTTKKENVIFTLTDYCPDIEKDKKIIDILKRNYKKIFCWIQGSLDIEYFQQLGIWDDPGIVFINPSLDAYNEFLKEIECDYIGTRLHAGIKAIQMKKRSIIIGVDNRAKDMHETYNLNYLSRHNLDLLEKLINREFETNVVANEENIKLFLKQFDYEE